MAAPISLRDFISGVEAVINGHNRLNDFESELKAHFGVKYCFLVSSGKAALTVILKALHEIHPDRDEILIPAFTCYSVPSAVVRAGLKVRLCDIGEGTFDFDYKKLASILSRSDQSPKKTDLTQEVNHACQSAKSKADSRLLAILPTHLLGIPSDVNRIRSMLNDPSVTIVEDAAQAMGESCQCGKLGTLGDVSFFSLGRGKMFCTVEGGIILTSRDDIAASLNHQIKSIPPCNSIALLRLILYGLALLLFLNPFLFWLPSSISVLKLGQTIFDPEFAVYRMSSFQAGLATRWLLRLRTLHEYRAQLVRIWKALYHKHTDGTHHASLIQNSALIRYPLIISDTMKRDSILYDSKHRGLGISKLYPDAISAIDSLKFTNGEDYHVARKLAASLITLPTHHYVCNKDVAKIKAIVWKRPSSH
ncbi:MAG: DegT/DnrJ/EryC1/StrS family aminotransferase [Smithella sp.]